MYFCTNKQKIGMKKNHITTLILIFLFAGCKTSLSQNQLTPNSFFINGEFTMPSIVTHSYSEFLSLQYIIPYIAHPEGADEVKMPATMFFCNEDEYDNFWGNTNFVEIELDVKGLKHRLQPLVSEKLKLAINDLEDAEIKFKVRGTDGVFRSWKSAERIWSNRIEREIVYHREHILPTDTLSNQFLDEIKNLGVQKKYLEQAALIFWIENNYSPKMMFGKLHKGPLYASCAAPGTSHHSLGIAIDLDIATLRNPKSLEIMAKHGFFRCIVSDFAHFVYLGEEFNDPEFLKSKKIKWVKHADGSTYMKYEL